MEAFGVGEFDYGGNADPRGGGVMATADVFERNAIRDTQVSMERKAIPKQAYLDPWRENHVLYRSPVGPTGAGVPTGHSSGEGRGGGNPKVVGSNRRTDIPSAVAWLRHDDAPQSAMDGLSRERRVQMGDRAAGGANPLLGTLALNGNQGKAERKSSQYYSSLTAGFSEEGKRQFLLTGERRRKFAETKHAVTDTLGLGKPLPLSNFKGGYIPTGPKYKTAPSNPYPKLACEMPPESQQQQGQQQQQQEPGRNATSRLGGGGGFDPWGPDVPWKQGAAGDAAGGGGGEEGGALPPASSLTVEDAGALEGPYDFDPYVTTRWGKTPKTSA